MFQAALAEALARSNLSQDELAERVGVRQQTVSKWVRGVAVPNQGRIRQIETATRTPRGQLARAAQEDAAGRLATKADAGGRGRARARGGSRTTVTELAERVERQEAELKALKEELERLKARRP